MAKPLLEAVVIESEAGWGAKPDGYLYATTRELFEERKNKIQHGNSASYGLYVEKEKTIFVSDEDWESINKSNGDSWSNTKLKQVQL